MFNKWLILVIAMVLGLVVSMPKIGAGMANVALSKKHNHKSWAPDLAYLGAKINLRTWQYDTAANLLEKSIRTWPKALWLPEAHFQYALAQEKQNNNIAAIRAYRAYAAKYPNHEWKEQARKRMANVQANTL